MTDEQRLERERQLDMLHNEEKILLHSQLDAAIRREEACAEAMLNMSAQLDAARQQLEHFKNSYRNGELDIVEINGRLRAAEKREEQLRKALTKARTFIEYAQYELQLGNAVLGDQFPRQGDADAVTKFVDAALADGAPSQEAGPLCPHGFSDGIGCIECDTDGAAEAQGIRAPSPNGR